MLACARKQRQRNIARTKSKHTWRALLAVQLQVSTQLQKQELREVQRVKAMVRCTLRNQMLKPRLYDQDHQEADHNSLQTWT